MALSLAACQDNIVEPEVSVYDNIMRFNLVGPNVQTKVSAGAFEEADQIGLYVTDYVNETTPMPLQISVNRANNSRVTFDGSVWTPEQTIYWGNGKSDVYAYYPYFETVTDVNSQYFELATDQSGEGYELSDFLWAKAEGVRQTDGTVNLEMKHLMSKLTVKIVAGEDYIGSLPEDATVHLHSTVTNANIDLENGAVVKDPYSGAKSIKMKNLGIRTFGGEKAVVYEAIVVPQMLENSVPLLEINSKSVSYLLEDSFNFRPGVAYTYTATLNTSTTAIKVEIGCEIEDWNNAGGDSGDEGEDGSDEGGSEDDEDTKVYTDLSVAGTANCYLIQQAGDYKFKAVIGNTDATVGNVKTVEVLWESFGTDEMPNVGDLVASASYKNGYIRFSTPENFRDGNAVIAAKNSKGTILWSWHIWCAEEGFNGQVYYNDAGTMMDRNLGATSATPGDVGALGLMYQWGRKDPFMGASSILNNVLAVSTGIWNIASEWSSNTEAESDPMTFYTNLNVPNGNWASTKTANDPCPAGWRVPAGGDKGVWTKALGETKNVNVPFDDTNRGVNCTGRFGSDETIWYPCSGLLNWDGCMDNVGGYGYGWSCSPADYNDSYNLDFGYGNVDPVRRNSRTYGFPVRCLKEEVDESRPEEVVKREDLSTDGTANSYIVSKAGAYKFTPTKGNSSESVGSIASAEVLWESFGTYVAPNVGDLVKNVKYENGAISFDTPSEYKEGNAVIAAKDASGAILWSWHIWLTDKPEGQEYYNNAGTMMDRNLGATSATPDDVGALGLMYQWGRKDPFMGSSSISSSYHLAMSTGTWNIASGGSTVDAKANPMTFYADMSLPNECWSSMKTVYDPCPAGWRVPDGGENSVWVKALGSSDPVEMNDYTYNGIDFSGVLGDAECIWYPAAGCIHGDNGDLGNVDNGGYFWTCSPHESNLIAYHLTFWGGSSGYVQLLQCDFRSCGFPVRCLKETN